MQLREITPQDHAGLYRLWQDGRPVMTPVTGSISAIPLVKRISSIPVAATTLAELTTGYVACIWRARWLAAKSFVTTLRATAWISIPGNLPSPGTTASHTGGTRSTVTTRGAT